MSDTALRKDIIETINIVNSYDEPATINEIYWRGREENEYTVRNCVKQMVTDGVLNEDLGVYTVKG